jgi:hypothetical protein
MNVRKLGANKEAVEALFDASASVGVDLIELLWNFLRPSVREVMGYEVPIITQGGIGDFSAEISTNCDWVEGTTQFFPDVNNRCWGYVFNTEKNRKLLMDSLGNNWFSIADQKVKKEIVDLAEANGLPTTPVPKTVVGIIKTVREKEAEKTIERERKEKMELLKRLKEVEEKLAMAEDVKEKNVKKRLSGVKIDNREEKMAELR